MAPFIFTKAINEGKSIDVYNYGKMQRDFTYISDIVECIFRIQDIPPCKNTSIESITEKKEGSEFYRIFNIGNNNPIELEKFISAIEKALDKKAIKNYMPMQAGDVIKTYADVSALENITKYKPTTGLQSGINNFVEWYKEFYV